jgi:hypothetical protein
MRSWRWIHDVVLLASCSGQAAIGDAACGGGNLEGCGSNALGGAAVFGGGRRVPSHLSSGWRSSPTVLGSNPVMDEVSEVSSMDLWLGVADTRGGPTDKPNAGPADNPTACFLGRHLTFAG